MAVQYSIILTMLTIQVSLADWNKATATCVQRAFAQFFDSLNDFLKDIGIGNDENRAVIPVYVPPECADKDSFNNWVSSYLSQFDDEFKKHSLKLKTKVTTTDIINGKIWINLAECNVTLYATEYQDKVNEILKWAGISPSNDN